MRLFPIAGLASLLLLPVSNSAGACEDGDYAMEPLVIAAAQAPTSAMAQTATIDVSAAKKKIRKKKKEKEEYMRAVPSK